MPKDPFGFLKAGWPGFASAGGSMASMAMPTSDPAELEKRIADLKTVEQWLDFNLTLLRTTIQGLEIQRGTLLALKAWQSQASEATDEGQARNAQEGLAGDTSLWWTAMQDQFQQLVQAAQNLQTDAVSAATTMAKDAAAQATQATQAAQAAQAAHATEAQGLKPSTKKKPAAKRRTQPAASKTVKRS